MALHYNPPPGWQVPRGEWRPPLNWEPDPAWPPAPPDWNFWLDVDQKAKHRPRSGVRRKYLGAIAIVALVAIGVVANALNDGEPRRADTGSTTVDNQIPITRAPIQPTWSPTPTPVSTKVTVKAKPTAKPTTRPTTTKPVPKPTKKPVPTVPATAPPVRHTVAPPTCTVAPAPVGPQFCAG
jgi:hypothetical protein